METNSSVTNQKILTLFNWDIRTLFNEKVLTLFSKKDSAATRVSTKESNQSPEVYYIPDLYRTWAWDRGVNPHFEKAGEESANWLRDLRVFSPKVQAAFDVQNIPWLAAASYPLCNEYDIRSGCDLMSVYFVLEELTDNQPVDVVVARCEECMDAIRNPAKPRPASDHVFAEITRQYWLHASVDMPKVIIERFERTWQAYLDSVVTQAKHRDTRHICTPEEYLIARHNNIGTLPCFVLAEQCWGLDIPHEIMDNPDLQKLRIGATEMIALINDLCSYRKEVLGNDADYNMVTVVMKHLDLDVEGAVKWTCDYHDKILADFIKLSGEVMKSKDVQRLDPEMAAQVNKYIGALADWVRGNYEWHFYSRRYFGDHGLEVKKTGRVAISKDVLEGA